MKTYKSEMPLMSIKYKASGMKKVQLHNSNDAFTVLKEMYDSDTLEYSGSTIIIFLNRANNTIGWTRHTSGGTASTVVDAKMILAEALLCGASGLMFSHNHPSSNLLVSREDINMTKKLSEACKIMDISLIDHIIVSGDLSGYYSFADEGQL